MKIFFRDARGWNGQVNRIDRSRLSAGCVGHVLTGQTNARQTDGEIKSGREHPCPEITPCQQPIFL